jgi:hypothetical protein
MFPSAAPMLVSPRVEHAEEVVVVASEGDDLRIKQRFTIHPNKQSCFATRAVAM